MSANLRGSEKWKQEVESEASATGWADLSIADQPRVLRHLERLRSSPPRVLLLEGGTAESRERVAMLWAALLNCPGSQAPCMQCPLCRQIQDGVCLDLYYLDGREGSIGIDMVRELRPVLGQAPRSAQKRIVVLGEAQALTDEAANGLLKSLEETDGRNHFLLLTAQRERLLPTLVSRSWVLTLSWSRLDAGIGQDDPSLRRELAAGLGEFLRSGRGWFARTMVKGQVDRPSAFALIHHVRHCVIAASYGRGEEELARILLGKGHPHVWRGIDLRLDEAEEALRTQVAPPLVLDWVATGIRDILTGA